MDIVTAYSNRSGCIIFVPGGPSTAQYAAGNLVILTGPSMIIRKAVGMVGRLSYSGEYLVPGIPEAKNDNEAVEKLIKFVSLLKSVYENILREV